MSHPQNPPRSPAKTQQELNVEFLEESARRLRAKAQELGVADKFRFKLSTGTWSRLPKLANVRLNSETPDTPALATVKPQYDGRCGFFWLVSDDRLAWRAHIVELLQTLRGLPASMSIQSSWHWEHNAALRWESGNARFVPLYEMFILLSERVCTDDSLSFISKAVNKLCAVDHALADQSLFDWANETFGECLYSSYAPWERGVSVEVDTRERAEHVMKVVFAAFSTELEREKHGWRVRVDLSSDGRDKSEHLKPLPGLAGLRFSREGKDAALSG